MKQFLNLNLILALIFSCFLTIKLDVLTPVTRPVNYQISSFSDYPLNSTGRLTPYLSSRSAIVIDVDSKAIIYEKNPDLKLLPASTTKIMTALVALDNYVLSDIVTIGNIKVEKSNMDLIPGEKITVENLLYGLLVASANDAAVALAQFYPSGEAGFVTAMNQKANSLHLDSTQFINPIGLDNYNHYTTVHDLSLLAAVALQNPEFSKIVSTISITVTDTDNTVIHELKNVNQLLGQIPGLAGVKTGLTQLAGECLVGYVQRNGHRIITVILDSSDRFGDSRSLIDWTFANHRWENLSAIH
ncbi:MAG: D-alanyl-D-alanine carboxypeptidase [Candidatus Beckwithbacteria bacterium]|nr:D-alanyl-D-alanine carboxypeptidase [Candidatus Beckwithbacteria bacterium]